MPAVTTRCVICHECDTVIEITEDRVVLCVACKCGRLYPKTGYCARCAAEAAGAEWLARLARAGNAGDGNDDAV